MARRVYKVRDISFINEKGIASGIDNNKLRDKCRCGHGGDVHMLDYVDVKTVFTYEYSDRIVYLTQCMSCNCLEFDYDDFSEYITKMRECENI